MVEISLVGKHRFYHRLLGSYSDRVVDFLTDPDTLLALQNGPHGACATITMVLSPFVDYQQAWVHSVDETLGRLDSNKIVAEGFDNKDRAVPAGQAMNYCVETRGRHIAPLGQALRLLNKLIDNVSTQAHPLLRVGWTLLSWAYTRFRKNDWTIDMSRLWQKSFETWLVPPATVVWQKSRTHLTSSLVSSASHWKLPH